MKTKLQLWLPLMIFTWGLDFFSKAWAEKTLSQIAQIKILNDWLTFRLVYNTGGVFGIMQGNAGFFHIITGLALFLLFIYFVRSHEGKIFNLAMSFVLGGALGNFSDRFFRHGVVDFIDMGVGVYRWPTYNVADIFILLGAFFMLLYFLRNPQSSSSTQNASSD